MPIIVKDITWFQTESTVCLHVPLHGAPTTAVDIFTTDDYLKASFENFFYECYPHESFDSDKSIATILSTKVVFQLEKYSLGMWPALERTLTKVEKRELKARALQSTQEKLTKQLEERRKQKGQLKRDMVSAAVARDAQTRKEIEVIREQEKVTALGSIEAFKADAKAATLKKSKPMRNRYRKVHPEEQLSGDAKDAPPVPMPRNCNGNCGVVEVEFTPRLLPTPSRESQEAEELEWLSKQAHARRSAGFHSDDLRPEEKSPDYILFKGKQFLECKNYLGAISAFTFGIELAPALVDFYILRSRAQFAIGNYHKCLRDCSTAIDIMKPEVYANLSERVECIHRRGMALFKLGLRREAAGEVKAAINLQPSPELTRDLYEILDSPEYVEQPHETAGLQEIDH